ncbi:hypothetical protein V2J94_38230 [Streptomyces sp. DSM 41524]|uniref:Uncharacterized protein n=1 Tax=Streptomyces asiaticus subsp. ignotus TaxID=3098222 RepID=A0ABU7Q8D5_9ACTN|nr:hypothetical protein [Streptomyces sp. DSM 41524]
MTSVDQVATLATFGSVWAVLSVGHNLADHVFGQSDHQAASKGAPSAAEVADGASPRGWPAWDEASPGVWTRGFMLRV